MEQKIKIVKGTTNVFTVSITNIDGLPYVPTGSEVLLFGLKQKPTQNEAILTKVIPTNENGDYVLTIVPADTWDLECGTYYYDIGLKIGVDFFNIVQISPFIIIPNVTEWGDQ